MAMTPQGRFLSDVVRPLAEKMRALDYEAQAALQEWHAERSAQVANDSTEYDDDRVDEGIPAVTGSAIHALIGQLAVYKAQMDGGGVRDVITIPCVRALSVD